jgi:hypothetical protein
MASAKDPKDETKVLVSNLTHRTLEGPASSDETERFAAQLIERLPNMTGWESSIAILGIRDEWVLAKAVASPAWHANLSHAFVARMAVYGISDRAARVKGLTGIIKYSPTDAYIPTLLRIINEIDKLSDDIQCAMAIIDISPYLREQDRQYVIEIAERIKNRRLRDVAVESALQSDTHADRSLAPSADPIGRNRTSKKAPRRKIDTNKQRTLMEKWAIEVARIRWTDQVARNISRDTVQLEQKTSLNSDLIKGVTADAAFKQLLDRAIDDSGVVEAAKMIIGRASPEDRALIAGMALPEHQDVFEAITLAKQEFAARRAEFAKPPPPSLSAQQIAAIKKRAKERPWSKRGDDTRNPFEWVRDNYKEWVGKGLLQSHLTADRVLHSAFSKRVSRERLPDWLDVPNESDAAIRQIRDPGEQLRSLVSRYLFAARMRRFRSLKS